MATTDIGMPNLQLTGMSVQLIKRIHSERRKYIYIYINLSKTPEQSWEYPFIEALV